MHVSLLALRSSFLSMKGKTFLHKLFTHKYCYLCRYHYCRLLYFFYIISSTLLPGSHILLPKACSASYYFSSTICGHFCRCTHQSPFLRNCSLYTRSDTHGGGGGSSRKHHQYQSLSAQPPTENGMYFTTAHELLLYTLNLSRLLIITHYKKWMLCK